MDQVGLPQLMKDPPSIKITTILVVLSRANWFYGSETSWIRRPRTDIVGSSLQQHIIGSLSYH